MDKEQYILKVKDLLSIDHTFKQTNYMDDRRNANTTEYIVKKTEGKINNRLNETKEERRLIMTNTIGSELQ